MIKEPVSSVAELREICDRRKDDNNSRCSPGPFTANRSPSSKMSWMKRMSRIPLAKQHHM